MNYENAPLLLLARQLPCQNCGADDGTVVTAHSNLSEHGKGKGLKSHACFFAALCFRCHGWLDNQGTKGKDPTDVWEWTREDKREMFIRSMHKTWLELWRLGLVMVTRR